jgi:hypothetical protein
LFAIVCCLLSSVVWYFWYPSLLSKMVDAQMEHGQAILRNLFTFAY